MYFETLQTASWLNFWLFISYGASAKQDWIAGPTHRAARDRRAGAPELAATTGNLVL